MTKPIQVGDLVRIAHIPPHAGAWQKGAWLVVGLRHSSSPTFLFSFVLLKGTRKLVLHPDLIEKVSE